MISRIIFQFRFSLCLCASILIVSKGAAETIYVPGVGGKLFEPPIPVSISGFTGEAEEVIKFDLYVQGFTFTTPEAAQFILTGNNNGSLTARAQDRITKEYKINKTYTDANIRRLAHVFVDDFLQALGRKGIGRSRIAFKTGSGLQSEIAVADFDGANRQVITHDNSIVAAPAWVPGRLALVYMSQKSGPSQILNHDLGSGSRSVVARKPGSNISPVVSPDGSKVALIMDFNGNPDLCVANMDGSGVRQLTKAPMLASSPCWSPKGDTICFAGKKDNRRLLWKISAAGGSPQQISVGGVPNPTEPDWSPDGEWIVFTSQTRSFDICVVPAKGGAATPLVAGEDPSWGPNSRTVIYARRSGDGRRLSMLDVPTKQTKDISRISGSNSQPSWAK